MSKTLTYITPSMGCDPELFVRNSKGQIVDSVTALREVSGVYLTVKPNPNPAIPAEVVLGSVTPDGVQAELHPQQDTCLGRLSARVFGLMLAWSQRLAEKGYHLDFTQTIELEEADLEGFDPSCRQLGCQPSLNVYDPDSRLGVDAATYRYRSAGGHIHIGHNLRKEEKLVQRMGDIVPLLDVLVGNTAVLIDRDPMASKRREVYGRAGEFRLPSYGLEYRTLSNFWLRASPLYSLMFELARLAFRIAHSSIERINWSYNDYPPKIIGYVPPTHNFAGELMSCVKIDDVIEAINSNNFDLAQKNFSKIRGFIEEYFVDPIKPTDGFLQESSGSANVCFPLTKRKLADFDYFISRGYPHFFGADPIVWLTEHFRYGSFTHGAVPADIEWTTRRNILQYASPFNQNYDFGHSKTWNNFLLEVVRPEREKRDAENTKMAELLRDGVLAKEAAKCDATAASI